MIAVYSPISGPDRDGKSVGGRGGGRDRGRYHMRGRRVVAR